MTFYTGSPVLTKQSLQYYNHKIKLLELGGAIGLIMTTFTTFFNNEV